MLRERDTCIKISRISNLVSHELTKLGRVHRRAAEWSADLPSEAEAARTQDCNLIVA
jgi:hypothetical protein